MERSSNADEALEVMTKLLEKYGQGGPCSSTDEGFAYHNSFIIADCSSAWVLETCGKHWVAEKITSKTNNSNTNKLFVINSNFSFILCNSLACIQH